jgi:diphthamide synthase (EF-2-diphthine--ammonia ligase)
MSKKVIVSWSGGKDSALALYEILKSGFDVIKLLTTVTQDDDRISIHGVRRALLEQQQPLWGSLSKKRLSQKALLTKNMKTNC